MSRIGATFRFTSGRLASRLDKSLLKSTYFQNNSNSVRKRWGRSNRKGAHAHVILGRIGLRIGGRGTQPASYWPEVPILLERLLY